MSGFWERLEARYHPPRGMLVLEDFSVASKLPVYNSIFACLNATLITVLLFSYGETAAGWFGVFSIVSYLVASIAYVVTARGGVYVHLMLWSSLAQNLAVHLLLGGFVWSGGFMMWGMILAISTALFLGKRLALSLTYAYVVAALILLFLESYLRSLREAPDPTLSAFLATDVLIVSLLILVPIVVALISQIESERARSESLLLNVLPNVVAQKLKRSPGVIADRYEAGTVLFADLVGFTDHSRRVAPEQLITELNTVFSRFDQLVTEVGAEKIKTMGDGYMAVAGAPTPRPDHVNVMCNLALRMQEAMPLLNALLATDLSLRVGIATGTMVAGVVGTHRFSYDLWGDTVNLASRMETLTEAGTIRVTRAVVDAGNTRYHFDDAGTCIAKGVGEVETFRLVGQRAEPLAGPPPSEAIYTS